MAPASKARKAAGKRGKTPVRPPKPPARKPAPRTSAKSTAPRPAKPIARPKAPAKPVAALPPAAPAPARLGDTRRHLLSLSCLRDGDEFLARLESDGGQITELKNRSLDQLLTLVAGELEDLLE